MRPEKHGRKLSSTLFFTILTFSISLVILFFLSFSYIFFINEEREEESRLERLADSAASLIEKHPISEAPDILETQFIVGMRYMLVSPDGEVLYDSRGEEYENYFDRPEIREAKEEGSSTRVRYSTTLDQGSIKTAVELDNGYVLRVSERRTSFLALISMFLPSLALALALICLISLLLSRVLTKWIVSPLDKIDASKPMDNIVYKEMAPLLKRIDDQQKQLLDQNRELARAEGMRRNFSANVSHEMKTPLQVISGYAEIMAHGKVPEKEMRDFAKLMLSEADNMRVLIDDVLTLSRLDDPLLDNAGMEDLALLGLCKQISSRLEPLAEKGSISIRVIGSNVDVYGNRGLLDQLIGNLISNAVSYSENGGEVTVIVGMNVIDVDGKDVAEGYVKVRDSGCGIPEDELDKIFERFYRIDKSRSRKQGGTGLGLAIAKHAAESHGGRITVESEIGKGSTFTAHLPLRY